MNVKEIIEKTAGITLVRYFQIILYFLLVAVVLTIMFFGNDILRVFVVMFGALYLFTTEKLPVEITALLVMVILMIFGLVTPEQGVSGFSNPATLTVLAMFVLSAGVQKTGIIKILGNFVFRFSGKSEIKQLLAISLIIGPISGFVNNTAAVAIMLPMILELSRKSKTPATKLLIPLSYISMSGGMISLLGTSTSILGSSILRDNGYKQLKLFEFTHLGLIVLGVAVAYFLLIGRFLLPSRENGDKKEEMNSINTASEFLTEVEIQKGSSLLGKTIKSSNFLQKYDAKLIKIIRGEKSFKKDRKEMKLQEGDVLVLISKENRIVDMARNRKDGIKLLLDFDETKRRFPVGTGKIYKVLTKEPRIFENRSISKIGFWERFGAAVIGINKKYMSSKRLADMSLRTGNILLIKASKSGLKEIQNTNDFIFLDEIEEEFNQKKIWVALSIIIGVILFAAFGILPIMVSALAGMTLMIITRCLDVEDVYHSISWNIIFLLAGIIPLGVAMEQSGAADMVANLLAKSGDYFAPVVILGLFYFITTILTEIVSNNASVVILIPIALSVAEKLSINPISITLVVIFAASTSFLTPIGYQTNTMVYGAGNYKFSDFVKVGAPLNLILLFVTTTLIVFFWGI